MVVWKVRGREEKHVVVARKARGLDERQVVVVARNVRGTPGRETTIQMISGEMYAEETLSVRTGIANALSRPPE